MHLKPELLPAFDAAVCSSCPHSHQGQAHHRNPGEARNRFVAHLPTASSFPRSPNSRTLAICDQLKSSGKQIVNADDVLKEHSDMSIAFTIRRADWSG